MTHQSDQISRLVMSDSLRPHESQHARPPCPSPTPGVHWDSCASSQWCHPAISSFVVPFSSCPQSLPASESFPMSQLFEWHTNSSLQRCLLPTTFSIIVVIVQSLSRVQLFAFPWTAACQASLSFTISQSLLKFIFIESFTRELLVSVTFLIKMF